MDHRDDSHAAKHLLAQLKVNPPRNRDIAFAVSSLEVKLHITTGDYSLATEVIHGQCIELRNYDTNVFHQVKTMILHARIYDEAGLPQKGFSAAIRAASLAYKTRLLVALWEAVGIIGKILNSIGEFGSAKKLLESIMTNVLESEDCELTAILFSVLADACAGSANQFISQPVKRKQQTMKALDYLDKACREFSKISDVKGQREMLAKKAAIMQLNGDHSLVTNIVAEYSDFWKRSPP